MTFGEKIRKFRKMNDWTQADLANQLGLTTRTVYNFENGQSYPKDPTMYLRIAQTFGLSLEELFNDTEIPTKGSQTLISSTNETLMRSVEEAVRTITEFFALGNITPLEKEKVYRELTFGYWNNRA